jgi:hypothetical protein
MSPSLIEALSLSGAPSFLEARFPTEADVAGVAGSGRAWI